MQNVDILRLLTPLLLAVAMAVVTVRRRLVRNLVKTGATSAATAVPPPSLGPIGSWQLGHLASRGVIRRVGDRVYLDEERFAADQRARRRRTLLSAALALAVVAAFVMLSRLGRP